MITVDVRDEKRELMKTPDGKPVTIDLGVPGTFRPLTPGPNVALAKRHRQARKHFDDGAIDRIFELTEHVADWRGFYSGATPVPCSHSVVAMTLFACPWIRLQVEDAILELKQARRVR